MSKTKTKRILFTRSYGKYQPGDLITLEDSFCDNMVRRGFASPAPKEDPAKPPETLSASEPSLDDLRAEAKDAGIKGSHLMKRETLLDRLAGAEEE